jgi:hypothetical protein
VAYKSIEDDSSGNGDTLSFAAEHIALVLAMLEACRPDFASKKKIGIPQLVEAGFVDGAQAADTSLSAKGFLHLINEALPIAQRLVPLAAAVNDDEDTAAGAFPDDGASADVQQ